MDDLSVCVDLNRVDLSQNKLKSLQGIMHVKSITFLKVDSNQLTTLQEVSNLPNLTGIEKIFFN